MKNEYMRQAEALKRMGLNEAEIAQVLEDDKRIDKGEKLFELPDELKAGAKKARQADRKKTESVKRERKENPDKREIIQVLDEALTDLADDVKVINPEREIICFYNGTKYRVVLSAPRT